MLIKNAKIISSSGISDGNILIENGFIKETAPEIPAPAKAEIFDAGGAYVAPGFIDLHIHGYGGKGTEDCSAAAVLEMSVLLAKRGVTGFCPALYPGGKEHMLKNLSALAAAFGKEKGAKILGLHLEGPFISPLKPGVMKPQDILPVDVKLAQALYDASAGHLKIMTFAPEVAGADELIKFAQKNNILLQAGHTNASYEEMLAARKKGVKHVTHIFNAMSSFNHRAPGAAGAAMMEDFSVEIVADGVHVHPAVVSFLGRVKTPEKIVLVTDALRPTAQTAGEKLANNERVDFKDGVFRRAADGVIAGSALTMIDGVKNLVSFGFPLQNAAAATAQNPAALIGLKNHGIKKGAAADIVIFDSAFNVKAIFIDGKPA
ncbi:MAG: N-acetylglucosamine-6-phosphate deacetylase [Elusimicrobium sp.]|jgi:N-acetylglucosamine-6-phosphate deacetylase|nr:N-acetylglucosamine-6-phosphate deacetylase [Elusimicrobium sp.]